MNQPKERTPLTNRGLIAGLIKFSLRETNGLEALNKAEIRGGGGVH